MSEFANYFPFSHRQTFIDPTFDEDEPITESLKPFVRINEPWTYRNVCYPTLYIHKNYLNKTYQIT